MYSVEMKKVMRVVRNNIRLDKLLFNQLSYSDNLSRQDIEFKFTYMDGLTGGMWMFGKLTLNEYKTIKKYIAWEYRRLERIYFL